MKSKSTAYLLLIFLGVFGAHKFYLGKVGMGFLYLFTGGLCCIGAFIDLFTLGDQVDVCNALIMGRSNVQNSNVQNQTVVVNIPSQAMNTQPTSAPNPSETSESNNSAQ